VKKQKVMEGDSPFFSVSFFKDFLIGFTQPLRDLVGSAFLYYLYSVGTGNTLDSTISTSTGYYFNIWIFLEIFVIVSIIDNLAGIVHDTTTTDDNPIDATPRFVGLFTGTFFWGSVLTDLYTRMGGDLGDIIGPVVIAGICLFGGSIIRLSRSSKRKRRLMLVEREY